MKGTVIVIIIVILIVLGVVFLAGREDAEAPVTGEENTTAVTPTPTPTPGSVNPYQAPPTKEFTVTGRNFAFSPATLTVSKGDLVKITFQNNEGFHDFVVDGYGVATKQAQAPATEVIEFVANKTGSFEYYCSVGTHRAMGMKGTLVVTE